MATLDDVTHHTLMANGVPLHVVEAGKGEAVILLHGWPQTWWEWRHIIPGLARRWRVIVPDLRGMGDSGKPPEGYDAETLAGDLGAILDHFQIDAAHLVGHDLGGPVAFGFAATHPQRSHSLTLLECPIFGVTGPGIPDLTRLRWHLGFHGEVDVATSLVTGRERMYLEWFYRNFAYDKGAITAEDVDEYVRCYAGPGALRASFEHYRAIPRNAEFFTRFLGARLPVPVLAYGGAMVMADLVLNTAKVVAEKADGGVIPQCGHWVPEERPEFLLDALEDFLKRQN